MLRGRASDGAPASRHTQADAPRKKVAEVEFATAFASSVFPVPGSPYRMTPFGGLIPISSYLQTRVRTKRLGAQETKGSYVQLRVCQRQLDGLFDLLDLILQAANVGVRLERRFLHLDVEVLSVSAGQRIVQALRSTRSAQARTDYAPRVRERKRARARTFMTDTRGSASSDRMPTTDNTLLCKSTEHPGSSCGEAGARRVYRSDPGQVQPTSQ